MVVFVDLDHDALPEHHGSALPLDKFPAKLSVVAPISPTADAEPGTLSLPTSHSSPSDDRLDARDPYPNRTAFSAALSCYP